MNSMVESIAKIIANPNNCFSVQDGRFYSEKNLTQIKSELDALGLQLHEESSFLWIEEEQPNGVYIVPLKNILEVSAKRFESQDVWIFELNGFWAKAKNRGSDIEISPQAAIEESTRVKNCVNYSRVLNHLIKKVEPEDLLYDGDYNGAEGVIVLHSSANGVFKIFHKQSIPEFSQSIVQSAEALLKFSSSQYKPYFINALFTLRPNELSITIEDLLANARTLTDNTRRNFELAQKQFDFTKFKDALLAEKDKYFNSIREVAGKIFSQVIGIPISLTGAIYASYKLSGDPTAIVVIIIAFVVYTFFYLVLQYGNFRDLRELRRDFMRTFVIIRTKSGLPKAVVNREYQVIIGRFRRYLNVSRVIIGVVIVLLVLAVGYMSVQLKPMTRSNEVDTVSSSVDPVRDSIVVEDDSTPSDSVGANGDSAQADH
jgi:hypothetical protein